MQPKLSREDEAKLVLENTIITRGVAWLLTLAFLLTIFAVPILQHVVEVRRNLAARRAEAAAGQTPQGRILPQSFDVLGALPSPEQVRAVRSPGDAWNLIPGPNQLSEFEGALEDESIVAQWFLPRTQGFLTSSLGVGNEQAYIGRERWLMYRPDVDYLTSRGFLDPALQQVRKRSGDQSTQAVQPDPIQAIVRFRDQLAERSIELIVMPAPLKPMIHGEKMSARYPWQHDLLQNPSYAQFLGALARENIAFLDVAPGLIEAKRRSGQPQFLETDTHWSPGAVDVAAGELAGFIQSRIALPPRVPLALTRQSAPVSNLGDIATMLKLPQNQRIFRPQRVNIEQVFTSGQQLWRASRDADILILGDSFTNVYSLAGLGWGEGAGLAEQLSYRLKRPVDVIAINAGGSYSSRQQLRKELLRGKNRLKNKRVVVWEFAMRDLMIGDWKLLDLPPLKGWRPLNAAQRDATNTGPPADLPSFRRALAAKAARFEKTATGVYQGAEGWMYYLPDVYYVSIEGFLRGADPLQVKAMVDFKRQLERRGIKLLVMPVPSKVTIHPENLGLDLSAPAAPQNASFEAYRRLLAAQNVQVYDPTKTLLKVKEQSAAPPFMRADSHWSFEAMEKVAADVSGVIKKQKLLPARPPAGFSRRPLQVANITDISLMLKRSRGPAAFVREKMTIQQVKTPQGQVFEPSREADVLVLGDSFSNIYSHGGAWGKGAGLSEQLAFHLQRPVDMIAIDGGGASKIRRELLRELLQGEDRLAGKKLVIYEFAARYLLSSQWKIFKLPYVKAVPRRATAARQMPPPSIVVRGVIKERVAVPKPGLLPYKDLVIALRLTNVQAAKGRLAHNEIVVFVWGMRDQVLTPAALWKVGQTVNLRLTPWPAVEDRYGIYNRVELEGDDVLRLDTFWGELR